MTEKRDYSGILFKNDRKTQPNHPDYTGNCTINGVDHFMDAWIKDGAKGKFMSFSFKVKEVQNGKPKPAPVKQEPFGITDEIPF